MNVPLVTNTLTTHFRSVSPPANRQRFPQQKSPSSKTFTPIHMMPKNQNLVEPPQTNLPKPSNQLDPDAFKVYVRIRPLNNREASGNTSRKGISIVKKQDNMIFLFDPESGDNIRKEKAYVFDDVFEESANTIDIYNEALTPAFQNMVQGFNSTIFAYGMTGAGKTFTMFGDIYSSEGGIRLNPGFVNLMVQDIFQVFATEGQKGFEFAMKLSYIEIYNEQIRDLLNPSAENLMVVEDPVRGVSIPNLSEFVIENEEELLKLILSGNSRRVMASTHANQFSSRSHAIIQLLVEKRNRVRDIHETYTQSKLCFVDLAGSERAATTENRGIRMTEGANINRSLLALGNCINILSDANKRGAFVPYRDSKLTRLLKDSLGGNTRTIMIACVSPATIAYEETVNTLNYASRARKIKKKIVSNVKEVELHVSQYKEIIGTLKAEIDSLKSQLQDRSEGRIPIERSSVVSQSQEQSRDLEGPGGSIDKVGSSLFANLEENWEIRQNLKDLMDLKAQNEASLATKKEELEKAASNPGLAETLLKEITSLQEVMSYNETIENDMQVSLEENLKEKKRIHDKMLALSSQLGSKANSYEGLERSLASFAQDKNELWNGNMEIQKEFLDLHKEKREKDTKIQQLEKEIDAMKRQLVEKDKLLAQNDQLNKVPSNPLYVAKTGKSASYTSRGTPLSVNRDQQPPVFNFMATKDLTKDIRAKKIENQGYISEGGKQAKDVDGVRKGEVIIRRPEQMSKGISEPSGPHNAVKKTGRFFKGSGLNENATKTAANTIRQMVKNKYKQAIQPVSVEELKNYAEKLKNINFENVPVKVPKKEAPRQQTAIVASGSQPSGVYNRNQQRIATEMPKNQKSNANKNARHGYYNKHQRSVGSAVQNQKAPGQRTSRNGTPDKDLSELSSIILQQNEQSLDHSVDEYILNNSDEKKNYPPDFKGRKSYTGKTDIQQTSSPNFHLNIMCLIKDDASTKNPNVQDFKVSSLGQIKDRTDSLSNEQYDPKEPRSVPYLPDKETSSTKPAFFRPTPKQPVSDLRGKPYNSQISSIQEETNQQGLSHEEGRKAPGKTKYIDKFIRSDGNLDNEGYVGSISRLSHLKHMRSTSLHPEDMSGVQKSLCSLEESSSLQRIPEVDAPKRSTNDIRSLEAARDIVRTFRSKLANLSALAEDNKLEEQHAQEIAGLIKDYNDNKDLLSNKDFTTLMTLETSALALAAFKGPGMQGKANSETTLEHKGHRSSSANVNMPKNIPLSLKDLSVKNESYRVYKRSSDFTTTAACNDSISSGRGSVPEERSSVNFGKLGRGGIVYPNQKTTPTNYNNNNINIYNQFTPEALPIQSKKDLTTSPDNQLEEYQSFRKSIEGKGKPNIEVQNLIEKQKKNLEDFDSRGKKDGDSNQQKKE